MSRQWQEILLRGAHPEEERQRSHGVALVLSRILFASCRNTTLPMIDFLIQKPQFNDSTWLNLGDRAGKTARGQATGTRNKQTSILPSRRRHALRELQGEAARWGNCA